MFKWIFNAVKWWAIGLAAGQLISGYKKEKTFKSEFDDAVWFGKVSVARKYLLRTNKKLIDETKLDTLLEWVKTTASEAQEQIKHIKKEEVFTKVKAAANKAEELGVATLERTKTVVKNQINLLIPELKLKLRNIESQLEQFESQAAHYIEEERTEQYRQIASKFALWKKTVSKYISDGIIDVEEKFELEAKVKYLSEKLEGLKSRK